jgi:hypothetical protein
MLTDVESSHALFGIPKNTRRAVQDASHNTYSNFFPTLTHTHTQHPPTHNTPPHTCTNAGLGLDSIGAETDRRGFVPVSSDPSRLRLYCWGGGRSGRRTVYSPSSPSTPNPLANPLTPTPPPNPPDLRQDGGAGQERQARPQRILHWRRQREVHARTRRQRAGEGAGGRIVDRARMDGRRFRGSFPCVLACGGALALPLQRRGAHASVGCSLT